MRCNSNSATLDSILFRIPSLSKNFQISLPLQNFESVLLCAICWSFIQIIIYCCPKVKYQEHSPFTHFRLLPSNRNRNATGLNGRFQNTNVFSIELLAPTGFVILNTLINLRLPICPAVVVKITWELVHRPNSVPDRQFTAARVILLTSYRSCHVPLQSPSRHSVYNLNQLPFPVSLFSSGFIKKTHLAVT